MSIILTAYDESPEYIATAIESVLAQSVPALEIIIVEDGGRRDYSELWSRYPGIRVIRQANQGPSAARNNGLGAARGDHVLFLDGDDRLRPHALEAHLVAFAAHPDAAMSYGTYVMIDSGGRPRFLPPATPPEPDAYAQLLRENMVGNPGTALFRRDALVALGGFDPAYRGCEDWDLFLRVAHAYKIAYTPEIVSEYRIHDGNCSSNRAMMLDHHRRILSNQRARIRGDATREAAWRRGTAQGGAMFARQQCADLIGALQSGGTIAPTLRRFAAFCLRYPLVMAAAITGEGASMLRRRLGPAPTPVFDRLATLFLARYGLAPDTARTGKHVVHCGAMLPDITALGEALAPGGVALVVVPATLCAPDALADMLASRFQPGLVDVVPLGNAASLDRVHGAERLAPAVLNRIDPDTPVAIAAVARAPAAESTMAVQRATGGVG